MYNSENAEEPGNSLFGVERVKHRGGFGGGGVCSNAIEQGSPSRSWRAGVPAEFSSNPNQTHLKQLIKVLLGILETSRQVCWGKLELNSAGHWPSRIKFDDPCYRRTILGCQKKKKKKLSVNSSENQIYLL